MCHGETNAMKRDSQPNKSSDIIIKVTLSNYMSSWSIVFFQFQIKIFIFYIKSCNLKVKRKNNEIFTKNMNNIRLSSIDIFLSKETFDDCYIHLFYFQFINFVIYLKLYNFWI